MAINDVVMTISAQDKFSSAFNTLNSKIRSTQEKMSGFKSRLAAIGKAAVAIYAESRIVEFGKKMVENFDKFDEVRKRLTLTTGSAEKANQAFDAMHDIWRKTEAPMDAIEQTMSGFMAIGLSVDKAKEKTQLYAEVAESTKIGLEGVGSLMKRAELSAMKGGASGKRVGAVDQKIAMQLSRSIPALGVAFKQMSEKAGISFQALEREFLTGHLSIQQLNQAMEIVAKNKAPDTIGETFTKIHKVFIDASNAIVQTVMGTTNAKDALHALWEKLMALESKFEIFVKAHPQLVKIGVAIMGIAAVLAPVLLLFNLMLSPITLIIAGLVVLYIKSETFRKICSSILGVFKQWWEGLKIIWEIMKTIGDWISKTYDKIKGFFTMSNTGMQKLANKNLSLSVNPLSAPVLYKTNLIGGQNTIQHESTVTVTTKDKAGVIDKVDVQNAKKKTSLPMGANMALSRS